MTSVDACELSYSSFYRANALRMTEPLKSGRSAVGTCLFSTCLALPGQVGIRVTNLRPRRPSGNIAWTQKAGCSPSYKCAYTSRWVGVYLSVVKTRNGTRYYSKMSVELSVSGKLRWESGTYQSGWWGHFPNVWPWF